MVKPGKKQNRKISFFKRTATTLSFSITSFLFGLLFLSIDNSITGNAILNKQYSFSALALIGFLLILCSIILLLYAIKNKN